LRFTVRLSDGRFRFFSTLAVIAALWAAPPPAAAQAPAFDVLHRFTESGDGLRPGSFVLAPDGTIYGTTGTGGAHGCGTIFSLSPAGAYAVLHAFDPIASGACRHQVVLGADGALYGWTYQGRIVVPPGVEAAKGSVFRLSPGGPFEVLAADLSGYLPTSAIAAGDGNVYVVSRSAFLPGVVMASKVFRVSPPGAMTDLGVLSDIQVAALAWGQDGNFYGVGSQTSFPGTEVAFRLPPGGSISALHDFAASEGTTLSALVNDGSDFVGIARAGGAHGQGTAFRLTSAGAVTVLHDFSADEGVPQAQFVAMGDGSFRGTTSRTAPNQVRLFQMTAGGAVTVMPALLAAESAVTALVEDPAGGVQLAIQTGGPYARGLVARVTTAGDVVPRWPFPAATIGNTPPYPAALVKGSSGFYGVTAKGGLADRGTLYRLTPDGTITTLHAFQGGASDGALPLALTMGLDGALYGTTENGGVNDCGTIFRYDVGPPVVLYHFPCTPPPTPRSVRPTLLTQAEDGTFYGTTWSGGSTGGPSVYRFAAGSVTTVSDLYRTPNALVRGVDGSVYGTTGEASVVAGVNAGSVYRISAAGQYQGITAGPGFGAIVQTRDQSLYVGVLLIPGVDKLTLSGQRTPLYATPGSPISLIEGRDGHLFGTSLDRPPWGTVPAPTTFRLTTWGVYTELASDIRGGALAEGDDGFVYGVGVRGVDQFAFRVAVPPAPEPPPPPPPPPQGLSLQANVSALRAGQTLTVNAVLTPGDLTARADAYVVIQMPWGAYYSLQIGGGLVPGLVPIVRNFTPMAITLPIFVHTFAANYPPGPYTFLSALTVPGTLQLLQPIQSQTVTFTP
jgi:uncharacterized repeat protein (TIGR03803 family)